MNDFNPQVSIVIPAYNGSNYLREAIDSALAQTYKNIEIIVINDGSNDRGKTEEIAKSYGDKIRYFCKENGGVASALNLGIREMKGEYFSWLSHDDVYSPSKIERQINFLKKTKKDNVLFSDYEYIDSKSNSIGIRRIKHIDKKNMYLSLIKEDPINGCTVLIPKLFFDDLGLFDERLSTTQDYNMWFRLAQKYDFVHLPEVLLKSRIHSEQGTNTITGHLKAENDLFVWSMQQLSTTEVGNFGQGSASLFYIYIAINLRKRGYKEGAKYSYNLALKHIGHQNIFLFLKTFFLIVVYILIGILKNIFWLFKKKL